MKNYQIFYKQIKYTSYVCLDLYLIDQIIKLLFKKHETPPFTQTLTHTHTLFFHPLHLPFYIYGLSHTGNSPTDRTAQWPCSLLAGEG